MKIDNLDLWARSHFDYFLDAVRIYLGVGLLIKGISFLSQNEAFASLNGTTLASLAPIAPYVHIVGGALLAVGLLARVAALANIPILFAAVFLVHGPDLHTLHGREGFEFSALVLFLLCLIAIHGAGPLSVVHAFQKKATSGAARPWFRWADEHPDVFADLIRIYLGVGLFIKGMYIMDHRDEMMTALNGGTNLSFTMVAAAHYIIPAHLVGGVLLAFGLLTRWAAAAQLPVLIGALFYMFLPRFSVLEMRQSLEFTALVLFLLALITLFGSGRLAVERERRGSIGLKPNLQPSH